MKKISLDQNQSFIGQRIDKALSAISEIGSRSRAAYLIDQKLVLVNNVSVKTSYIVKINDEIQVMIPEESSSSLEPYNIDLDILFEDQDIIVINKPSGLVVHPAAGHAQDTLANALISHTRDLSMKFGEDRPGIVHRLDKETSGVLVVAKNDFAHEKLALQFRQRTVHRIYHAICFGKMPRAQGKIETSIARHPKYRKKLASTQNSNGKLAITNYKVLQVKNDFSYIELKLETGRTHQIRVHLSESGCPIVGDVIYGADKKVNSIKSRIVKERIKNLHRFLLHACELGFFHPVSEVWMEFKVDWPSTDWELVQSLGFLR